MTAHRAHTRPGAAIIPKHLGGENRSDGEEYVEGVISAKPTERGSISGKGRQLDGAWIRYQCTRESWPLIEVGIRMRGAVAQLYILGYMAGSQPVSLVAVSPRETSLFYRSLECYSAGKEKLLKTAVLDDF